MRSLFFSSWSLWWIVLAVLSSSMQHRCGATMINLRTRQAMEPVTSIHARVTGSRPVWDAEHQVYVSEFGNTFEERYRAFLDSVNTASVEGALKYVHRECINVNDRTPEERCRRRHGVNYIVFLQVTMVQPPHATPQYDDNDSVAIGYCPYVSMDRGTCSGLDGTDPTFCWRYHGGFHGHTPLGFCVGGEERGDENWAKYDDAFWFSFPNSCPTRPWGDKSDACRAAQSGGLCPYGTKPDGYKCTFSYDILGYTTLDEVVGITEMVNPLTGKRFNNYSEFCEAGGVEFNATVHGESVEVHDSLPFWQDPSNTEEGSHRIHTMVQTYQEAVATQQVPSNGERMRPLPTPTALAATNPTCDSHAPCADASCGCHRRGYGQICEPVSVTTRKCSLS